MRLHHPTKEIGISFLLIIFLVIICSPFTFLMSPVMLAGAIVCLVASFAFFASFIWHEDARDERELMHRMSAGRNAFLTGTIILLTGIIYQSTYHHSVDPWLLITLSMMIIAKTVGIIFSHLRA